MRKSKIVLIGCMVIVIICAFVFLWPSKSRAPLVNVCQKAAFEKRYQCWDTFIERAIAQEGIDAALTMIAHLYDTNPDFANPCHDLTHKIGQAAYIRFSQQRDVPLTPAAAYCAFGFYHGFMEMLLSQQKDIAEARGFCAYIDKTLGSVTPNARLACYHGIGHGATDIHNPAYAGSEAAVVGPALAVCEQFAETDEQLTLCATGVFDSVSIAYYNSQNGMTMRRDDPLWLCRAQPERYKEACYRDMMPAILWMGEYDLAKAAPLVGQFVEAAYQRVAMETIADNSIRFIINKKDPIMYLSICRSVKASLVAPCIRGLAAGMMQFGPPEKEYEGALAFCGSKEFTPEEQRICYESVVSSAKGRYSREKVDMVCQKIERVYQRLCDQ